MPVWHFRVLAVAAAPVGPPIPPALAPGTGDAGFALVSRFDRRPMQHKDSSPRYRVTAGASTVSQRFKPLPQRPGSCADRSWLPFSRRPSMASSERGLWEFAARLLHQQNLHLRFLSLTLARWGSRVCERQAAKAPLSRLLLKLPVSRVPLSAFLHCNASRHSF